MVVASACAAAAQYVHNYMCVRACVPWTTGHNESNYSPAGIPYADTALHLFTFYVFIMHSRKLRPDIMFSAIY